LNSLSRVLQAVLWGVVTGSLLSFVQQGRESDPRPMTHGQPESSSPSIRLYRDPVCGTYVSPEISIKLEKSGQITHFCSAECRERHGRPTARAARA
jgi:YHS domain-containing protein